jgi:hypothetical protein
MYAFEGRQPLYRITPSKDILKPDRNKDNLYTTADIEGKHEESQRGSNSPTTCTGTQYRDQRSGKPKARRIDQEIHYRSQRDACEGEVLRARDEYSIHMLGLEARW